MAGDKGDQGSKEEIAEGMSEAGKGQVKGGDEAGKAGPGHGADPGKLTEACPRPGRAARPALKNDGSTTSRELSRAGGIKRREGWNSSVYRRPRASWQS